jgi:hypothetical protein
VIYRIISAPAVESSSRCGDAVDVGPLSEVGQEEGDGKDGDSQVVVLDGLRREIEAVIVDSVEDLGECDTHNEAEKNHITLITEALGDLETSRRGISQVRWMKLQTTTINAIDLLKASLLHAMSVRFLQLGDVHQGIYTQMDMQRNY